MYIFIFIYIYQDSLSLQMDPEHHAAPLGNHTFNKYIHSNVQKREKYLYTKCEQKTIYTDFLFHLLWP